MTSQLTITQDGQVLTETVDGVTMPADYGFDAVNEYVHGVDRYFEELQWLALGMATEIDKLRKIEKQRDELLAALKQYEQAFDGLFAHCLSNGVFNAWRKQHDCTALNLAHEAAGAAIANVKEKQCQEN